VVHLAHQGVAGGDCFLELAVGGAVADGHRGMVCEGLHDAYVLVVEGIDDVAVKGDQANDRIRDHHRHAEPGTYVTGVEFILPCVEMRVFLAYVGEGHGFPRRHHPKIREKRVHVEAEPHDDLRIEVATECNDPGRAVLHHLDAAGIEWNGPV
jgi:hypothetical protein